ncbi:MAG: hypothetical protein AVDCRST_MAG19-12, partial [uncultured Thermomicrobiales bacterium]
DAPARARPLPRLRRRARGDQAPLPRLRDRDRRPLPARPLPAACPGSTRVRRGLRQEPRHHQGGRGRAGDLLPDRPRTPRRRAAGDGLPGGRRRRPPSFPPPGPSPGAGRTPQDPGGPPGEADHRRGGRPPPGRAPL